MFRSRALGISAYGLKGFGGTEGDAEARLRESSATQDESCCMLNAGEVAMCPRRRDQCAPQFSNSIR